MNQQVTFLSDGGDLVRELQYHLNSQAEHLLDWFHITMRLTVIKQMIQGLENQEVKDLIMPMIESAKWYLWHGNVRKALKEIEDCHFFSKTENQTGKQIKLQQTVEEFQTHIENNAAMITNYGERYRNGETIATGFVESTVNQIIAKRFVKKNSRCGGQNVELICYCKSGSKFLTMNCWNILENGIRNLLLKLLLVRKRIKN